MTHLLAVYDNVSNQVYEIPSGMTAAEFATQLGLAPENWAAFDIDDYPGGAGWGMAFVLVDNLPSPNTVTVDLAPAKVSANLTAKQQSATTQTTLLDGYTSEQIAAQASLAAIDRDPVFQVIIDGLNTESAACLQKQADIAAATSIAELNNIVSPPTGIINIGRGAAGALDLNNSYYTEFNSASMTEAETELYVPGTTTVIPYGSIPGGFDSIGNCFVLGDYLIQIREVTTGQVIAEFEVPLAPANVDITF